MLDVNVWVNHYLSLSRGQARSAAQQLVQMAFDGHCRLGPLQPIISHAMLDAMQVVLVRLDLPELYADAARNAVEAAATGGITSDARYLVLGSAIQPVQDVEDRGVLETAMAANVDLLATHNIADFVPGARSDIDAKIIRVDPKSAPDILQFRHSRLKYGLVIASVFAARSWLVDGARPPEGILDRFFPV